MFKHWKLCAANFSDCEGQIMNVSDLVHVGNFHPIFCL